MSSSASKRPASDSSDEPIPKRPKVVTPTLPVGDPVRLLTTLYLTDLRRLEGYEGIPSDILGIVFEYTAPTALERLAKDCPASLLETVHGTDKKKMSADFYDAAWEIFHHYATGTNKECTPFPHKTMTRDDIYRYGNTGAPFTESDITEGIRTQTDNLL